LEEIDGVGQEMKIFTIPSGHFLKKGENTTIFGLYYEIATAIQATS
jgi:hypothetical protein